MAAEAVGVLAATAGPPPPGLPSRSSPCFPSSLAISLRMIAFRSALHGTGHWQNDELCHLEGTMLGFFFSLPSSLSPLYSTMSFSCKELLIHLHACLICRHGKAVLRSYEYGRYYGVLRRIRIFGLRRYAFAFL
jgi:hypothetical protein